MYAEISAAIASAKTAIDVVKAAHDLANYNEISAAVSEVYEKLIHAQGVIFAGYEKQLALAERVRELEQEIVKFKDWDAQAKDYTLKDVGFGIFAYVYTPTVASSKPRHWACAKCFQQRKISILQRQYPPQYLCDTCGAKIDPRKNGQLANIADAYST